MSETARYRHLVAKYCYRMGEPACGIDLASQGDPVVPWFWQLDLSPKEFAHYNGGNPPAGPINLYGDAFRKFVEPGSLDVVYASHILEDKPQSEWPDIFRLWSQALKPGGKLIILVPEKKRWAAAIAKGQPPNCSHRGEPSLGDMSSVAKEVGMEIIEEKMADTTPEDYTIIGVFRKP